MRIKFKCFFEKYWHYIILIIYFMLLLYQHKFIHMYGDDYYYGSFLKENFLRKHMDHYMYINGRAFVHFIVTLILYFKTNLFMIVNPLMIIGVVILVAKLVTQDKEDYKYAVVLVVILFSMLSIDITRQSIFWVDGSFNYLFPMLLALATFYFLKKSIYTRKKYWYLPLIALLAGMTVEQATAITFGGILLILMSSKLIYNRKLSFNHYLTLLLSFVGGLTVVLAPGTFIRADIEGIKINIIENIENIVKMLFLYKDMEIYNLLLLICIICIFTSKKDKGFLSKTLLSISVFCFVLVLKLGGNYTTVMPLGASNRLILSAVLVGILVFIIGLIYLGVYNLINEKNDMVLISLILAFGAQFMMIISPVYDYRILLSTVILYFITITTTIIKFKKNRYMWCMMALVLSIYITNNILIFISLGLIIFEYINNKYGKFLWATKINSKITEIVIITVTIISVWNNISGYRTNHSANIYNETAIQQYLQSESSNEIIILKKMPLYKYGWSYPYVNPYHMKVMKSYYGIDEEVKIIYLPYIQE